MVQSNHFNNVLGQILLTNWHLNILAASHIDFVSQGLISDVMSVDGVNPQIELPIIGNLDVVQVPGLRVKNVVMKWTATFVLFLTATSMFSILHLPPSTHQATHQVMCHQYHSGYTIMAMIARMVWLHVCTEGPYYCRVSWPTCSSSLSVLFIQTWLQNLSLCPFAVILTHRW